jgi:hypothetical protein
LLSKVSNPTFSPSSFSQPKQTWKIVYDEGVINNLLGFLELRLVDRVVALLGAQWSGKSLTLQEVINRYRRQLTISDPKSFVFFFDFRQAKDSTFEEFLILFENAIIQTIAPVLIRLGMNYSFWGEFFFEILTSKRVIDNEFRRFLSDKEEWNSTPLMFEKLLQQFPLQPGEMNSGHTKQLFTSAIQATKTPKHDQIQNVLSFVFKFLAYREKRSSNGERTGIELLGFLFQLVKTLSEKDLVHAKFIWDHCEQLGTLRSISETKRETLEGPIDVLLHPTRSHQFESSLIYIFKVNQLFLLYNLYRLN